MGLIQSRFVQNPLVHGGGVNKVAAGLTMAGSIVFNGSDEYLRIASFSSSSPNRKTFTVSFWIRFDTLDGTLYDWRVDSNNLNFGLENSGTLMRFGDDTNGVTIYRETYSSSNYSTGQWHHMVIAVDTTLATASDRVLLYLDGVAVTVSEATTPGLDDDCSILANGAEVRIGASIAFTDFFDGRIADFIVVEGQQLAPSAFGYDNGGLWSWKDYTGAFGTHGFRINPQDSSEIGTDQSDNGNDFTLTNMDTSNFDSGEVPPV